MQSNPNVISLFVHCNLWWYRRGGSNSKYCIIGNFCSQVFMGTKWVWHCAGGGGTLFWGLTVTSTLVSSLEPVLSNSNFYILSLLSQFEQFSIYDTNDHISVFAALSFVTDLLYIFAFSIWKKVSRKTITINKNNPLQCSNTLIWNEVQ